MANNKLTLFLSIPEKWNAQKETLKVVNHMSRISKIVSVFLVIVTLFTCTAYADNKVENNPSAKTETNAEVDIKESDAANKIVDKLETILDPENDELENEVTETLEKHSDNWFVRFFKTIIDAISSFLDAIFKLASEAAKIGVD